MNKFMKLSAIACAAVSAGCSLFLEDDGAYPSEVDEGFVSIFNGKDLTGWYGSTSYGVSTNEPGVLQCFLPTRTG